MITSFLNLIYSLNQLPSRENIISIAQNLQNRIFSLKIKTPSTHFDSSDVKHEDSVLKQSLEQLKKLVSIHKIDDEQQYFDAKNNAVAIKMHLSILLSTATYNAINGMLTTNQKNEVIQFIEDNFYDTSMQKEWLKLFQNIQNIENKNLLAQFSNINDLLTQAYQQDITSKNMAE